jgi:hypothetical protein
VRFGWWLQPASAATAMRTHIQGAVLITVIYAVMVGRSGEGNRNAGASSSHQVGPNGKSTRPTRQSGNNQAPEPGWGCDPPELERRLGHGHNRNERRETTRGKMAAPPTRRLCGALAAYSRVRGSRSISISEQRAPGLAAARIDRCISVGAIGTDSAHSSCPHSVRGWPPFAASCGASTSRCPRRRRSSPRNLSLRYVKSLTHLSVRQRPMKAGI